jgi:spermidine synthase
MQANIWGWGLVGFVVCCAVCAIKMSKVRSAKCEARSPESVGSSQEPVATNSPQSTAHGLGEVIHGPPSTVQWRPGRQSAVNRVLWVLLPACASVLLLAVTNKICQDVAVIPFLWVLPLAVYLLSFVVCFDNPRWYARVPFALALAVALGGMGWTLSLNLNATSIPLQLSIYVTGLFICSTVCHGELYRLKPPAQYLTEYYLMIAGGGALGGLVVALLAPLLFTDYFELHWGLFLCGLLFLVTGVNAGLSRSGSDHALTRQLGWRWAACAGWSTGLVALGIALWMQAHTSANSMVWRVRNFYGVLTVLRQQQSGVEFVKLIHGRTAHGLQFVDAQRSAWPTLYYGENSGAGLVLSRVLPPRGRRIGIVGEGAGTLAAYARAGDLLRIYEINPEVDHLARSHFSFLSRCAGKIEIVLGDARLSLEREPSQQLDLLVLDAFNSDAIPVHLLTREAFEIYGRHLRTNSILAIHISNRSVNLRPVVLKLARDLGYEVRAIDDTGSAEKWWVYSSEWMLLARNGRRLGLPVVRAAATPLNTESVTVPVWTDDFASLVQVLRWRATTQFDPAYVETQISMAGRLSELGDCAGAIAHYRLALRVRPNVPEALNNLAWLLATSSEGSLRDGVQAVQLAKSACWLTQYRRTVMVGTLAAAYAEAGRFPEAISTAETACTNALAGGDAAMLARNQQLLALYRAGQPYHEEPPKAAKTDESGQKDESKN